jgi:hypothetical protein
MLVVLPGTGELRLEERVRRQVARGRVGGEARHRDEVGVQCRVVQRRHNRPREREAEVLVLDAVVDAP